MVVLLLPLGAAGGGEVGEDAEEGLRGGARLPVEEAEDGRVGGEVDMKVAEGPVARLEGGGPPLLRSPPPLPPLLDRPLTDLGTATGAAGAVPTGDARRVLLAAAPRPRVLVPPLPRRLLLPPRPRPWVAVGGKEGEEEVEEEEGGEAEAAAFPPVASCISQNFARDDLPMRHPATPHVCFLHRLPFAGTFVYTLYIF